MSGLVLVRVGKTELAGGDLIHGIRKVTMVTGGSPGRRRELGGLVSQTIQLNGAGQDMLRMTHLAAL